MKFTTVAYKGSKRKLLENIKMLTEEVNPTSFFDGFSGTGIVSAFMRQHGYVVSANDLNYSSYVYGKVFLEGYNREIIEEQLEIMNGLRPLNGWLTENYSGHAKRKIRGTNGKVESRPLGYIAENAMKIDAAREYISNLDTLDERDERALVFSIILAADRVFNNSNDQKSALKNWCSKSLKKVYFTAPSLIVGPLGYQHQGDILQTSIEADVVYLDPPYTHGVLYASCYHLNDSIASWSKPALDYDYAIPRPKRVCFRKNKQQSGGFYSQKTAALSFDKIVGQSRCERLILSYSDAPRNVLTIEELLQICNKHGKTSISSLDHKLCTQPNNLKKISTELKEFFIVVDKA